MSDDQPRALPVQRPAQTKSGPRVEAGPSETPVGHRQRNVGPQHGGGGIEQRQRLVIRAELIAESAREALGAAREIERQHVGDHRDGGEG